MIWCIGMILLALFPFSAQAQDSNNKELFAQLAIMDSLVFDNAFIECDAQKSEMYFTEDVEFYHDKSGMLYNTRSQSTASMEKRCSEWFKDGLPGLKRVLVPGSLEVHPMKNYGAIQMGVHQFYALNEGRDYILVEIAKFTHLWKLDKGEWRISRILSYDHQPVSDEK